MWLSQNPFRSIYFACQAMAAEMSTGVLALGHLHGRRPAVSMLVTSLQASFVKKATERIYFTCDDGEAMLAAIEKAVATGEGQTFTARSIGKTAGGDIVSEFLIEWSFKAKR
jgi:translation elongation factor EF-Tu-like GTPase